MSNRVNVFENKDTAKKFVEISGILKGEDKALFTKMVKRCFDKKIVSEEGEFVVFKVTMADLLAIAGNFI